MEVITKLFYNIGPRVVQEGLVLHSRWRSRPPFCRAGSSRCSSRSGPSWRPRSPSPDWFRPHQKSFWGTLSTRPNGPRESCSCPCCSRWPWRPTWRTSCRRPRQTWRRRRCRSARCTSGQVDAVGWGRARWTADGSSCTWAAHRVTDDLASLPESAAGTRAARCTSGDRTPSGPILQ